MNEVWNICARATSRVDGYLNQTLRATIDIELLHGPDFKVTSGPGAGGSSPTPYWGNAGFNSRMILSRWPVLQVTNVQTCPNSVFPRQWTALPANYYEPEVPPIGIYGSATPGGSAQGGQAIIVAPGYINWNYGRNGWAILITYINGYPHTWITSQVAAGATTIPVEDTTGWALENYFGSYTGATGTIKDSGQQESIHVTGTSTASGSGNLTIASPGLAYPHAPGTIVTTVPTAIEQACILFATAEALTRGATSTTIHDIGGHAQGSMGDMENLISEGELLLYPYKRTV